ncbi:sensor histidine kinase [Microbispora cellulosiformans]|uniref:Sensor histidine kinase n=1 Tax=Microbispora cellulosiformans TaxID=2614688 RepID=A0A5J5K8I3_9ACTN|nr:histidine kinase [Microbispora cellulosiformans]KAA9379733.1 sensor histidine kinase [Microbispora cellulosiformans]
MDENPPAFPARTMAYAMAAVALGLTLLGVVVQLRLPAEWQPHPAIPPDAGIALTFPATGAFLVSRRPRLIMAWLMCAGGLLGSVNVAFTAFSFHWASQGEMGAAIAARAVYLVGWAVAGLMLAVLLPLYSPDGRLPSRGWRAVVVLGVLTTVFLIVMGLVRPDPDPADYPWPEVIHNPLEIRALAPYYQSLWMAPQVLVQVCVVAALASLALRMRRADPATRRQIAWPLLFFAVYVLLYLLGMSASVAATLWTALIPPSILFAVLRYRLYGIDTVISRTFVAAGLLVGVSAVYFGAGALSSLVVFGYHQVAGLAAALFAGAFFQPLRRALQRVVDRALYGPVGDPALLAERLTQEVRRADPADALASVVTVVRDGLAVEGVAVEIADGSPRYVESGHVGPSPREVPLVWHGEPVGRLLVGPPGARRFAAAHDERVLATLLPYVADVAHAVRMAADLQRSRERILAAREEERRRLRRDLHDGLGQTLGAMAMTINIARMSLTRSPSTADGLLRDLRVGMDAVAGDIRELVYGLRPPALDDLGLAGAVRALAEETLPAGGSGHEEDAPAPVDVTVRAEGDLAGLPAAVEVAVYRIVQEALNNVRRHARATRVQVEVTRTGAEPGTEAETEAAAGPGAEARPGAGAAAGSGTGAAAGPGAEVRAGAGAEDGGGELRVRITDDGIGLPARLRAGVGMSSMRERAAELGGSCTVTAPDIGGTVVEARFPLTA